MTDEEKLRLVGYAIVMIVPSLWLFAGLLSKLDVFDKVKAVIAISLLSVGLGMVLEVYNNALRMERFIARHFVESE